MKKLSDKIAVIYHNADLDGLCSAAIIKKVLDPIGANYKFIGMDYNYPLPNLEKFQTIIIVDFSFKENIMRKLNNTKRLIWIDHHKQIINDLKNDNITGLQRTTHSACELTWEYFFTEAKPKLVELLGIYDTFRHMGTDNEIDIRNFQYGARIKYKNIEDILPHLDNFDSGIENNIREAGEKILEYLKFSTEKILKEATVTKLTVGDKVYKCGVINVQSINPIDIGLDFHSKGYDILINIYKMGNKWKVSMYTQDKNIDLSEIAKMNGGGGHRGAAGYYIKNSEIEKYFNSLC